MKLKDVILGVKLPRQPCSITALDNITALDFALRLVPGDESRAIEDRAREAAGIKSPEIPKPDDVVYLQARMVHTLLYACIDKDVEEAEEPFFANAKEVLHYLDDNRIAFVYSEQKAFQSRQAPPVDSCEPEEFVKLTWASVKEAQRGGDPERPFVGLPYRKLTSFAMLAAGALTSPGLPQLLLGLPTTPGADTSASSRSSSTSSASSTSSTAANEKPNLSADPGEST